MLGTRQWISQVEATIGEGGSRDIETISNQFFKKLLAQGKKLSQIISYIWLAEDLETAQKLDGYFKRANNEELKRLFFAKDPETDEYKSLLKIFKEEKYLPIFDEDDEPFFVFRIITDKFEGNISDPGPSDNGILVITLPYPPRPDIFNDFDNSSKTVITPNGFTTIKQSELKEWLNQAPDQQPYFYKNNPYIPATSS